MKRYFDDCKTMDDAKKRYHKLAKELHPDVGGTNAEMVELKKQYDAFMPKSNGWQDDPYTRQYQFYGSSGPKYKYNYWQGHEKPEEKQGFEYNLADINKLKAELEEQKAYNRRINADLLVYQNRLSQMEMNRIYERQIHTETLSDYHKAEKRMRELANRLQTIEKPYKIPLWEYLFKRWGF